MIVDAGVITATGVSSRVTRDDAGERGDQAFAALFESQCPALLRLAYLLTGDPGIAEDVVADAFASMYARWRSGRIDDPDAYLRRAVVNQVRGRFRRNATRRRFESSVAPMDPVRDDGFEERERVRQALLELPPGQRAVVALRFLEDRSEAETAALLGVTVGTVKSQAAHGLERLRHALDREGVV
jgi:RNA polymerase sigma-70 factor (sigma-E family)